MKYIKLTLIAYHHRKTRGIQNRMAIRFESEVLEGRESGYPKDVTLIDSCTLTTVAPFKRFKREHHKKRLLKAYKDHHRAVLGKAAIDYSNALSAMENIDGE